MKKFLSLIIVVVSLFSFSGCFDVLGAIFHQCPTPPYDDPSDYPEYPDYQSEYTEEEHIARLTEIAESGSDSVENNLNMGKRTSVEVEIVYAFYDNDPEFFLVNFTFDVAEVFGDDEWPTIRGEMETTNEAFILGYIHNDEYIILEMEFGENPWKYAGYQDEKKYFGSHNYAVKIDGIMTTFFQNNINYEYDENGKIDNVGSLNAGSWVSYSVSELNEQQQKELMEYNYAVNYGSYHIDS